MQLSRGLTSVQAAALLKSHGPNRVASTHQHSTFRLLLNQFRGPLMLVLIAATVLSMFLGEVVDGIVILAILIPSGFLNFWQENRASKTMMDLLKQLEVSVRCWRDAELKLVPISQLVPADVVELSAGDIVPADCKLDESQNLLLDESALTGESFAVEKSAATGGDNLLHFGTHVASGSCRATITATGLSTKYGELVGKLAEQDVETGFERGTKAFGMLLVRAMLILSVSLVAFNLVMGRPFIDSLLFSLALAVGLTPQLLPTIITVSLAAGARVLAKNRVLVKRLDAIEDFGSMNILCSDKTGTLTIGVSKLEGALDAAGQTSENVLRLAALNASLQTGFTNPLDDQIMQVAGSIEKVPVLGELPYDFQRKRLSVLLQLEKPTLVCKGAYSNVLATCSKVRTADGIKPIASVRKALDQLFESQSNEGKRVLAVATREFGDAKLTAADENELVFEGFLIFADELKPDAKQEVENLKAQGIDFYLITGDNKLAAAHIAKQVGLDVTTVVTGEMLKATAESQLAKLISSSRVYADVDPLQKALIVKTLSSLGNTVGFFGDGINDSAAIKGADVGISVNTAVDIARESASIVLLDKELNVIGKGVRLGRTTFLNTMKYVKVASSASFGNVFSMAIASVFLPFLPLLPLQILLLNFLTDAPALTIATDRVDEDALSKPQPWDVKSIRRGMISYGLLSSVFDMLTFAVLIFGFKAHHELFRSTWFIESSFTELVVMLVLRTSRPFYRSRPGLGLMISSALMAATVVALPYSPLATVLGFTAVPWQIIVTVLGLVAIYALLNELVKKFSPGSSPR